MSVERGSLCTVNFTCQIYNFDLVPDKTRIVFSCPTPLAQKLTEEAIRQGIPKSQLITELIELGLQALGDDIDQTSQLRQMEKKIDQIWKWYQEERKGKA